jgi:hypothetical protein
MEIKIDLNKMDIDKVEPQKEEDVRCPSPRIWREEHYDYCA